jgi:hypothetical protein
LVFAVGFGWEDSEIRNYRKQADIEEGLKESLCGVCRKLMSAYELSTRKCFWSYRVLRELDRYHNVIGVHDNNIFIPGCY